MKARACILTLILILTGSVSYAGNGETAFRKMVNKWIHYPMNVSKKLETVVYVEFTVTTDHKIRIDSIACQDEEISAAIAEQILKLKVDPENTEVINKTFYYKFKLEVEQ